MNNKIKLAFLIASFKIKFTQNISFKNMLEISLNICFSLFAIVNLEIQVLTFS